MGIPRFWRETGSRYRLVGNQCEVCGRIHFPKRSFCHVCHRQSLGKMKEVRLSGKGTVESFTIIHQTFTSMEDFVPYVVAIVMMDEGIRVTSQIVGVEPEEVEIGMPVVTTFRKLGEEGPSGVIYYGFKFVPSQKSVCSQTQGD